MAIAGKPFGLIVALAAAFGVAGSTVTFAADHEPKGKGPKGAKQEPSTLSDWFGNEKMQFFRMPAFNVPVIRDGRVIRQVSLAVTLVAQGVDKRNVIIDKRHALQNAFLSDLHAVLAMQGSGERSLNLETVKIRLKRVADRVLGPGIARDVLVENAYTRRVN